MNPAVPLARPYFGPEETQAVSQVLDSGWVSQGPRVEAFEQGLAELLQSGTVAAVNSGTSALMLALRALDIGPGHSVVVPAFSCAATALPVLEAGARLLFAEVHPATFNVTWDTISQALAKDTRAVIVAHMFGRIADMETIAAECRRHHLLLIEDAALALGSRTAGRYAGTFGAAGCFSFHPRKILTTGEGGAVCTNDPQVADRIREARNYGAAQTAWRRFQTNEGSPHGFSRMAFNCKLTDLQAAIGLVQLKRLPEFLERRREIAARYARELADCPHLTLPAVPTATHEHVFQAYVCTWTPDSLTELTGSPARLAQAERSLDLVKQSCSQAGVAVSDAAQFLPGLPVFGGQSDRARPDWPVARVLARLGFAIPIFPSMTEAQIERVVEALRGAARIH